MTFNFGATAAVAGCARGPFGKAIWNLPLPATWQDGLASGATQVPPVINVLKHSN